MVLLPEAFINELATKPIILNRVQAESIYSRNPTSESKENEPIPQEEAPKVSGAQPAQKETKQTKPLAQEETKQKNYEKFIKRKKN